MDMNYGCDVSNRYTGYLDSSDHGNAMSNAAGKNKRKTKKRRKSKNSAQKVDKCTNTSQIIECDGDGDGGESSEQQQQQQQQQQQLFDVHHKNEATIQLHQEVDVQYTDDPTSLISTDSTVQSDTSKEAKESDSQSNNTLTEDQPTTTENETKWSDICCEEEKAVAAAEAAAAAAIIYEQKLRDEPELVFKDQRVYPTVYFYNSNFGSRSRRVVYDFHDGRGGNNNFSGGNYGGGGRRQYSNYNYHDASRTRQQSMSNTQINNNREYHTAESNAAEPNAAEPNADQMPNKEKKRRNRNQNRHRRKFNYARSDTIDNNHPGDKNEMPSVDDTEKYSNTSNDRTSYGRSSVTPPIPPPTAQKHNNNNNNNNGPHEYPKNRNNKFKYGMPERTFTRRRTDLVRNV